MSSLANYWIVLLYSRVHEPMWMTHMNTQVICGMLWITGVYRRFQSYSVKS